MNSLEILKAKNKDVGLTTAQARKRDRKEYRLNPSQASSLKRFRAQQGKEELEKLKKLEEQGQLTQTQQARQKVLEDGRFRMGFGTNSVKTLTKKTETKDEKTNRLSGERNTLLEKTKKNSQKFNKNNAKRLRRLQDGTLFKKSVLERQGKSLINRKLDRMKTKKNIMGTGNQPWTKKEINKLWKLNKNITRLEAKKNNRTKKLKNNIKERNELLKKSGNQALSKSEKAQLSKLQYGTRRLSYGEKSIASREGKNKTVRNKEASAARLGALEARYSKGKRLSLNNTRKLYRDSGSNSRERQEKDLERLTKRKEIGDLNPLDQKKFERLQRQIQQFKNPKTRKNIFTRKIMRGEQEMEALNKQKALGDMGNESSKRQKELNLELKRLRKIQAKRNVKAIGREAERQRLLANENGNNTEA